MAGAVVPLLLALVTVPIYLRVVGVERYGVLQIAWLLLGYFGLFDLGLGRATSFRIAAQRDSTLAARAETFWSALAVNIAMGLMGGGLLWLVADWAFVRQVRVSAALQSEIRAALPYLAASVPIATITGVLTGALQGREKFLITNSISVTSTTLFQLLPLGVVLLWGPYLPALLAAALFARSVGVLTLFQQCWTEIAAQQPVRINRGAMAALLRFGGWVTLTAVFGPMLVIADRFAMGAALGMAAVAVYSIPYNLASRIAVMPAALTNALFPKLSAASLSDARDIGTTAMSLLLCLISPPVLAAILLAEPFLKLWVGTKLGTEAGAIARVLILAFWFNALALVAFTSLQARGRPDIVTKILLVQIPPYWLGLYVGMHWFGLMGCAVACLGRMVMDYLLQSWLSEGGLVRTDAVGQRAALLGLAVLLPGTAVAGSVIWGSSSVVLATTMAVLSWRDLPAHIRITLTLRWATRPTLSKSA